MSVPGAVTDPGCIVAREIRYVGDGGDGVDGYLAAPIAADGAPAVIVIHEIFGVNEHIRDVVRRFAAIGFIALAPDLFSREGAPPGDDMKAAFGAMNRVPDARVVGDVEGAAAVLREQQGASGRVGCVGFCSGGRHALLAACSSVVLDAAVDCWGARVTAPETTPGRPVPVIDLVGGLGCPLLLVGGAEDGNPSPEDLRRVRDRAVAAGHEVELEIYPAAGHAFFADTRPNYRSDAAFALWPRMTAFLAEHLRAV